MTHIVDGLVDAVLPTVVKVRREIHAHPELSGEEYRTTELIADTLREAGLSPRARTPKTGLVVELGAGDPAVAFRADIDALPIQEPDGLPYVSRVPGVMHACGHDAHAAIGVGVALVAADLDLPGRLRVIFQPAEETFPGGAYELMREGVLDGAEAILAYHVDPSLPTGRIGLKAGPITSSADRFYITLEGPGGHTARPHATVDLIYAAGLVVTQLPAMLDRLLDARSALAIVFGRIQGGTADNVIPTQLEMSGTVRTADRELWEDVAGLMEKLIHDLVAPLGAKAVFHYQRGIPPVINDPDIVARLERSVAARLGPEALSPTHVSMGAEDFARYLDQVSGALMRLGCQDGNRTVDLHSAGFTLDEGCLEIGIRVAIGAVLDLMQR